MKSSKREGVVLAVLAAAGVCLAPAARAEGVAISVRPSSQLTFKEARPGFQTSALWGDQSQGAWGSLARTAPGYTEPWHTHSSALRLVVIAGRVAVEGAGSTSEPVGPGSYLEVPANVRHRAVCAPGSECVFLLTQSARYDRIPDGSASGRPGVDAGQEYAQRQREEAERFEREVWESP